MWTELVLRKQHAIYMGCMLNVTCCSLIQTDKMTTLILGFNFSLPCIGFDAVRLYIKSYEILER